MVTQQVPADNHRGSSRAPSWSGLLLAALAVAALSALASSCRGPDDRCTVDGAPCPNFCAPGGFGCLDCLGDGDCGDEARPFCIAGTCVPACSIDQDCENAVVAPRCDTTRHACVQCLREFDCNGPCVAGVCAECNSDMACRVMCIGGTCVTCFADSDCAPGRACIGGLCDCSHCEPSEEACNEDGSCTPLG
jgi:hypothetical protein